MEKRVVEVIKHADSFTIFVDGEEMFSQQNWNVYDQCGWDLYEQTVAVLHGISSELGFGFSCKSDEKVTFPENVMPRFILENKHELT